MLAFWVFIKDFVIVSRDKQSLVILIAMPLILIAILGAALSGVVQDSSKEVAISHLNIGIVDEDQSEQSELFIHDILMVRLSSIVNVVVLDENEVDKQLQKDKITLAFYIPKGFGEAIDAHRTPIVKMVTKDEALIERSILSISLLHYQNINLAIDHIMAGMTRMYVEQAKQTGRSPEISGVTAKLATLHDGGGRLGETKTERNTRMGQQTVGSFEYYAVALGVMFMMITVTNVVGRFMNEKEDPVYLRQFVTHLTTRDYLLGKFMGLICITFAQLFITILGSRLIFKVDWGSSSTAIVFVMIVLTISLSALGILIASFVQRAQTFNTIGSLGTQLLAALGGSFVPIYVFPEWMVAITTILPNALGVQMFLTLMTGGTLADIWQQGAIALVVSMIMFAVAWYKLNRKGGGINV